MLWNDLRIGFRSLRKRPAVSLVAILTLALGIGANVAIFTVVDSLLIRPLAYDRADRIVFLWQYAPKRSIMVKPTADQVRTWRQATDSFDAIEAFETAPFTLLGEPEPETVTGARVSPSLFSRLGVRPTHGRAFRRSDAEPGSPEVVLLGHGLWSRRFGGDPEVIGSTIRFDDTSATVIGVMPRMFSFFDPFTEAALWTPLPSPGGAGGDNGGERRVLAVGFLQEGTTVEAAQAELDAVLAARRSESGGSIRWTGRVVTPGELLDSDVRDSVLVLQVAVAFVLLIACANVANLLLARGTDREHEMTVRTALGASRWQLLRQLLVENGMLALAGGAVGLLAGAWVLDLVVALRPTNLDQLAGLRPDLRSALFAAGVTLVATLLAGLAPALRSSSLDPPSRPGRRERGGTPVDADGTLLRNGLVVAEVALCLMLLVGAGLLLNRFLRLNAVDPGFDPEALVSVRLELPEFRYPEEDQRAAFSRRLLDDLGDADLPGVESVALATGLPPETSFRVGSAIRGPDGTEYVGADELIPIVRASPGYFGTLGIDLLRGRGFTGGEEDADSVVVNDDLARRISPEGDPVGERLVVGSGSASRQLEVTGVVPDVALLGLGSSSSRPQLYRPLRGDPGARLSVAVRTSGDSEIALEAIESRIRALDPQLPIASMAPVEELLGESISSQRFGALLMGAFAALALCLALMGIYGVLTYTAGRRTREIGIRIALGARAVDVVTMVARQGLAPVGIGIVLGLGGAVALGRYLSTLLGGLSATDPGTLAATTSLLVVVALVAVLVPARRAARIDPMSALREE